MERWLKEEVMIVKNYYNQKSKEELIGMLNNVYTWEAIKQRARKLGVTKRYSSNNNHVKKWTEEKINTFKKMWVSGSTEDIKATFSEFTSGALKTAARRFGVKRDLQLQYKNKLKILLEENTYNYYWLGFIMADGYLSNNGDLNITLSVKDYDHLNNLSDYLGVNINTYNGNKYGKYTSCDYCTLRVRDVTSTPQLINRFKINDKKTYTPCSLGCLSNDDNFLAFFCGFVDGDGCITQGSKGKVNMLRIQCHSSWLENFKIIGNRLNQLYGFNFKCYIDKQGYLKFAMYRYDELVKLKKEIDRLKIPYLERKWGKIN